MATEKPVYMYEIVGGPSHWDFVLCCVDPYPTSCMRRAVEFSTVRGECGGRFTAQITTLHSPSFDTWLFEADVEGTEWDDACTEHVAWKHVHGQYSTQTRTGFFYEKEK